MTEPPRQARGAGPPPSLALQQDRCSEPGDGPALLHAPARRHRNRRVTLPRPYGRICRIADVAPSHTHAPFGIPICGPVDLVTFRRIVAAHIQRIQIAEYEPLAEGYFVSAEWRRTASYGTDNASVRRWWPGHPFRTHRAGVSARLASLRARPVRSPRCSGPSARGGPSWRRTLLGPAADRDSGQTLGLPPRT
jgi:hypothetical protein